MSFIGRNPTADFLELKPQSADPTSPSEGHLQYADGTARAVGLWIYKGGNWTNIGNTTVPALSVSTKTANYTLTSSDDVIIANASGSFTLTLPSAAANSGKVFYVIRTDTNGGTVSVGGLAFLVGKPNANYQAECVSVVSDGTSWYVLEASSTNYITVSTNGTFTPTADGAWHDYGTFTLPKGTWSITANAYFTATGNLSPAASIAISTTSGNSSAGLVLTQNWVTNNSVLNSPIAIALPSYVVALNGTTTYYCKYAAGVGVNSGALTFTARKIGM